MQSNALLNENVLDAIADEYSALDTLSAANDVSADAGDAGGYVGTYKISYMIS